MSADFVEGWTERVKYQLKADGETFDISGMTVALVAHRISDGAEKTFTGTVGIQTAASSVVYFDPTAADLLASDSPLRIRWKVTDASSKVAYFPREPLGEPWNIASA